MKASCAMSGQGEVNAVDSWCRFDTQELGADHGGGTLDPSRWGERQLRVSGF